MNIGIYIYDEAEVLDFSGPFEVFSTARRLGAESWNVFLISETLEPIKARGGFTVLPDYSFQNHPQVDLLIVVGGVHTDEMNKTNVLHWVASVDKDARHVASVCTGAFILANAGLLKGLAVTTHWEDIPELKQRFPDLDVMEEKRWVTTSKYTTSGGISAGIDMSLFLVSKFHSQRHAELVAHQMEYNWQKCT
ncbi:DJ-1/PfpI family protein [Vibrio parahaemolyticus]|uniref:DJ-1/PfpI family protein n=1 Tax=Vibrio parahaemolyticus TaxID=670 RepID=UPI0009989F63|nr:DJ-1/PfpI family protein [Vibrio parahaemolyticus]EIV8502277.1 DJ-1/PfpI family protein [Vibrio parahaemolyticus]EJG1749541.1 DJ-1/PfpI family protein [Vibrio parahaemolyticus]MBE4332271.1 DJ-1/PfpI family protein [Vibrio parahaemolyticus]MBE4345868.1 DJ-1/PfpI family protein [Vibrio parahaemolyticus]MDF4912302.1 DJ-1/PfpI family protein [Vibrio parahaemolyticus]